jgi:hypothetical protein
MPLTVDARLLLVRPMNPSAERRRRGRCQARLMAARGRPPGPSAEALSGPVRTSQRWRNADHPHGRAGLRSRWAPGRAPRMPEGLAAAILAWMPKGLAVSASTRHSCCATRGGGGAPSAQRLATCQASRPSRRLLAGSLMPSTNAQRGALVLRRPDEARGAMLPTRRPPLSVTGPRPRGGHLDGHAGLDVLGARNRVTGRLTTRLGERPKPASRRTHAHQRHWPQGGARPLREIARAAPAAQDPRGVLVTDRASGPQGPRIPQMLAACPHVELSPWARDSPPLHVLERFWTGLRRRATQQRLVRTLAPLKRACRMSLCSDQTRNHRGRTVRPSPRNRTKSAMA